MTKRARLAKVLISGVEMRLRAPGLKQIKRKGEVNLYWARDESEVFATYAPATVRIHVDIADPAAKEAIERICQREQESMLLWSEQRETDKERLAPKFDRTMGSLCRVYEHDPESGFSDIQENTQSSYRDSLKIIEDTIGLRRIDKIPATNFKTYYRNWKAPVSPGEPERVRRAYGCIQIVKVVLGYGMQANLLYDHCERLLKAMGRMRFPKNPPRDSVLTYEHAEAIVTTALKVGDVSTALVQALQFECFTRQIDVLGKWRTVKADYKLKPGEVRNGDKAWSGMTLGMIVSGSGILRIRTSKTGQFVVHDLSECELVVRCLDAVGHADPDQPVARRKDGRPWATHMDYGKQWREYANASGVPKSVWSMDSKAGGITEASGAGASHDDLAGSGVHATKTTTRKIYMRGAAEISARVQKARQKSRHAKTE